MKERPILFSAPMVRALLAGNKTQTRRPVYVLTKNAKSACFDQRYRPPFDLPPVGSAYTLSNWRHAEPGYRLWVRESFHITKGAQRWADGTVLYRADHGLHIGGTYVDCAKWKPSIHMFRKDSRILLEVVSVRVERLQDISEADAKAEGCDPMVVLPEWSAQDLALIDLPLAEVNNPYRNGYAILWNAINGAGSWDLNPWVWVVEFKRITP